MQRESHRFKSKSERLKPCFTADTSQRIQGPFTASQPGSDLLGQTPRASETKVSKTLITDSKRVFSISSLLQPFTFNSSSHHPIFLLGNEVSLYCTDDHWRVIQLLKNRMKLLEELGEIQKEILPSPFPCTLRLPVPFPPLHFHRSSCTSRDSPTFRSPLWRFDTITPNLSPVLTIEELRARHTSNTSGLWI